MEALTNAEKNAEQKIKEIKTEADQKVAELEKDLASERQLHSTKSEPPSNLVEQLKKSESLAAQRLSDYNKEIDKNRQLSSEIDRVNELRKSSEQRIAEMQKSLEVGNFENLHQILHFHCTYVRRGGGESQMKGEMMDQCSIIFIDNIFVDNIVVLTDKCKHIPPLI